MVIYFDTETTGLKNAQVCQLSYIMQSPNSLVAKNFFMSVDEMNPYAYEKHGFSVRELEKLSQGKVFADYILEIKEDFERAALLVAHNAKFDIGIMKCEYQRVNDHFHFCDKMCTMEFMRRYLKIPDKYGRGYKPPRLSEFVDRYVTNEEIVSKTAELFKTTACYHDARYDTTAMFLAVENASMDINELKERIWNSAQL